MQNLDRPDFKQLTKEMDSGSDEAACKLHAAIRNADPIDRIKHLNDVKSTNADDIEEAIRSARKPGGIKMPPYVEIVNEILIDSRTGNPKLHQELDVKHKFNFQQDLDLKAGIKGPLISEFENPNLCGSPRTGG